MLTGPFTKEQIKLALNVTDADIQKVEEELLTPGVNLGVFFSTIINYDTHSCLEHNSKNYVLFVKVNATDNSVKLSATQCCT